jgi:hypothetical protein
MTLFAGGMLQWTGSYVPLFVVAGLLHPVGYAAILLFGGRKLEPADMSVERAAHSPGLIGAGTVIALVGAALAILVGVRWDAIVAATRSLSAAAQGLTASVGVMVLGLALLYAGRGRRAS